MASELESASESALESALEAAPESTPQPAPRRVNWRAWSIAVLAFGVITAIVVVGVLRGSRYPQDARSSDVKACTLVSHAAVAQAAGTTEFKNPEAPKIGTVKYQNSGDDSGPRNVDIHNLDECTYYLNPAADGSLPYLNISLLPYRSASVEPVFAAAASHSVKDGVRYALLGHVGTQAALGTTSSGSLLNYVVEVRVSGWQIEVQALLPKSRAIAVAKLLADAPRLRQPPKLTASQK